MTSNNHEQECPFQGMVYADESLLDPCQGCDVVRTAKKNTLKAVWTLVDNDMKPWQEYLNANPTSNERPLAFARVETYKGILLKIDEEISK